MLHALRSRPNEKRWLKTKIEGWERTNGMKEKRMERDEEPEESDLLGAFISRLVTRAGLVVPDERARSPLRIPPLRANYPPIQIVVAFRAAGRKL